MNDLCRDLTRNRLTTAEILYHLPDHPTLLQSYIWQAYDLAPHFPKLFEFLDFWAQNLDGKLHSVTVADRTLVGACQLRHADATFSLH